MPTKVSSWQCMSELHVTILDDVESLFLSSFYGLLPHSKSGIELPKVPVVSRYFVAYLTAFVSVAPFFRTKDERVQTRTDKFFNRALKTLARANDTELCVYLNRKATAWYRRFPPMHSPDRAQDIKKAAATVASGDEQGGGVLSPPQRPRTTTIPRCAPWRQGLRMSPKEGAGMKPDLHCFSCQAATF